MNESERIAAISKLTRMVGSQGFYFAVAVYDPKNASKWDDMAKTQWAFADGEAAYNTETRRYSELMRLTLHLGIIEVFKDAQKLERLQGHSWNPDDLFDWFMRAHLTAFRSNGWLDKGVSSLDVVSNVRGRNLVNGSIATLFGSRTALQFVFPDPYMQRAAQIAKMRLDQTAGAGSK
jgi:hypothetical protein